MSRPKLKMRGAAYEIPIGDLGYKAVLTPDQMKELINSLRTKNSKGLPPGNWGKYATGFYTKEELIDFYEEHRPKVKRK